MLLLCAEYSSFGQEVVHDLCLVHVKATKYIQINQDEAKTNVEGP
jgi:hypothetical protein